MALHVVILAAGQGKRMNSILPKVLQPLGDRSMLGHVVRTAQALSPQAIHVVYGFAGERVKTALQDLPINWVEQAEQLGTGHAVRQALPKIADTDQVLVLYGDVPLVLPETLQNLVGAAGDDALALLTTELDNPAGYGRIERSEQGQVLAVVEDKDASDQQRLINEINTGLLCGQAKHLKNWLANLSNDNAQGEYYLTDCIAMAVNDGIAVHAQKAQSSDEVQGVNNKTALAAAERILQGRLAAELLTAGVTLRDPQRIDIRGQVTAGKDCHIDVNCVFEGQVTLGNNVHIGPNCLLKDCEIADNARINANTVIDQASVGEDCQVGPFARLRPAAQLHAQSKVGNFVEIKKSTLGKGSKVNHLSYVGDAQIGAEVNIGAGVITCNYDGINKHTTVVEDGAFIGSDVQLIAPVTVGKGATIGAGSTITQNTPDDQLTLSRSKQVTIEGWQRPSHKK